MMKLKDYWIIALENVLTIALFVYLAVHFNKWWIALFSLLLITTIKK